jgi:hypothetical protein
LSTDAASQFAAGLGSERLIDPARNASIILLEWQDREAARALLFRLLLLLYAEGRGLLPRGAVGLRALRAEIAGRVGDRRDGMTGPLQAAYADRPAALQERVTRLCERLTQADPAFRLWPFSDLSAAPCATVPDWGLAMAIELLTRSRDDAYNLVCLDYRTLPVRSLGSVYEQFLDRTGRKLTGSFYTPAAVVEYLVRHTLGPALARVLRTLEPRRADWLEHGFDFRILDPAMGSGHFLVAAAQFLVDRLARALPEAGRRAADCERLRRHVWQRCLYGLDVDPCAVALARWSAWLEAGLPGTSPALVQDNLRCGDALLGTALDDLGPATFDAVLGNPPYLGVRTGRHDRAFADRVRQRFQTAKRNWDVAGLFLETVLQGRLGRPRLGMIVPLRLATNRDHAPLRQLLFQAGGPERVLDCGTVFGGPSVAACVLVTPTGSAPEEDDSRRAWVGTWRPPQRARLRRLPVALLRALPDQPLLSRLEADQVAAFQRLTDSPRRLADYVVITRGMECGKNDRHVRRCPGNGCVPVISGEGVRPFRLALQDLFMPLGQAPPSRYKRPELFTRTPKLLARFVAPYPVAAVGYRRRGQFQHGLQRPRASRAGRTGVRPRGVAELQPHPLVVRHRLQRRGSGLSAYPEVSARTNPSAEDGGDVGRPNRPGPGVDRGGQRARAAARGSTGRGRLWV